jgi:uncharacterized protein (DUF2141 family)
MRLAPHIGIAAALFFMACTGAQHSTRDALEPIPDGVGTLVVEIEGLRNVEGGIALSVYRSAEGFPDDTSTVFRSAQRELTGGATPVFRFDDLQFGHYAISILHDENGNGELDTSLLGVPSEGFGFSNNPRIGFGAPSFESCRFRFDGPEITISISMKYF